MLKTYIMHCPFEATVSQIPNVLVFIMTKRSSTITSLIHSWNLSRRFEWWIYYEYYKCTFLIIHICIGHIAIKIRMLMSHTYTPGYSLSFLVFYTKISSLLKFVQQSMPSLKKARSSSFNIKLSIDKFYSLNEKRYSS